MSKETEEYFKNSGISQFLQSQKQETPRCGIATSDRAWYQNFFIGYGAQLQSFNWDNKSSVNIRIAIMFH